MGCKAYHRLTHYCVLRGGAATVECVRNKAMKGGFLKLRPKLSFVCEKHLKDLDSDCYNSKAMKELLW